MKRYKRPFVTGVILLMILYVSLPILKHEGRAWTQRYQAGRMHKSSGSVSSSLAYLVRPGKWLTFNLVEGTKQLRIISNGHIHKPDNISVKDDWKYILRYQLVDKDGKVITDEQYHQRTRLTSYRDQQGEIFFGNFYSGYALTPLDGRLIMLSMSAIEQAASIRISFIQQSHEVEEASIRLYVPGKVSEHRLADIWLRMSDKYKEVMAKRTVYPASLLSETEKKNLLKHQWQPVGPAGVEDEDYISRTLYVLKEVESEKLGELLTAAGLQLDSEYPGIIAIPELGGQLDIKLTGLDGMPLSTPVALQLNWFGRKREHRWHRHAKWLKEVDTLNYKVQGGFLQIKADEPVLVHAFLNTASQQHLDITPKPLMIAGYLAVHGIDYQVLHIDNQSTAIRVDIRQILGKNTSDSRLAVEYQWFNQQKKLITSGFLSVNSSPSIYDRLTGELEDFKPSDPVRYYLDIPKEVSQLRLVSKRDDLLVNAYNQPYRFNKIQRVPESFYVSIDKKNWYPSWFLLRPDNEIALLKQHAVGKIAAQYRPPLDDPALLADQYLWEDYRPLEQTQSHFILTKMANVSGYRDEALASVYCQLQPNQLHQVKLKTYGNLPRVSPELIYIRPRKNAFDVSVYVDRKLSLDMPAIGQQGSFRLTGLMRGRHSIKLKTRGGGQWLMNYISACPTQTFLKRRVFKLKNRQLSFIYTNKKAEDRMFSGRFYTANGNNKRSVIQVSIEPMQKRPSQKVKKNWTFTRRRYDLRAAKGPSSIVLYKHGYYLNSGESFFIPFNSDMPKGRYRIKMTLKGGASGYVALSQVDPGLHEQRRFYRETND